MKDSAFEHAKTITRSDVTNMYVTFIHCMQEGFQFIRDFFSYKNVHTPFDIELFSALIREYGTDNRSLIASEILAHYFASESRHREESTEEIAERLRNDDDNQEMRLIYAALHYDVEVYIDEFFSNIIWSARIRHRYIISKQEIAIRKRYFKEIHDEIMQYIHFMSNLDGQDPVCNTISSKNYELLLHHIISIIEMSTHLLHVLKSIRYTAACFKIESPIPSYLIENLEIVNEIALELNLLKQQIL